MRTSGPCLPSGRRSASTSSAGSVPGQRQQPAELVGHARAAARRRPRRSAPGQRVVHEHHVGVAAVAQLVRRRSGPSRRPPSGSAAARAARPRSPAPAAASAASRVAAVDVGERVADLGDVDAGRAGRPTAIRNSSRRRIARTAVTASTGSACRRAAAVISFCSASRGPAAAAPRRCAEHPHALRRALQQVGGVAAGGEQRASRCGDLRPRRAAVWRYQCVEPSASEICRKPNSPASGFGRVGEPAEHRRQQGALDRRASRDSPLVSASRCRSAAAGSA